VVAGSNPAVPTNSRPVTTRVAAKLEKPAKAGFFMPDVSMGHLGDTFAGRWGCCLKSAQRRLCFCCRCHHIHALHPIALRQPGRRTPEALPKLGGQRLALTSAAVSWPSVAFRAFSSCCPRALKIRSVCLLIRPKTAMEVSEPGASLIRLLSTQSGHKVSRFILVISHSFRTQQNPLLNRFD
jgi:hypothetical protein